jgi:hypothetical protein
MTRVCCSNDLGYLFLCYSQHLYAITYRLRDGLQVRHSAAHGSLPSPWQPHVTGSLAQDRRHVFCALILRSRHAALAAPRNNATSFLYSVLSP